jgi:hypothetical protein
MAGVTVCTSACFALALCAAGNASIAAAQGRLDYPRYSLDVPTGWSSQVENERWTLYLIGAANDLGIAPVGKGLAIGLTLTRADAHGQLWATAKS